MTHDDETDDKDKSDLVKLTLLFVNNGTLVVTVYVALILVDVQEGV